MIRNEGVALLTILKDTTSSCDLH